MDTMDTMDLQYVCTLPTTTYSGFYQKWCAAIQIFGKRLPWILWIMITKSNMLITKMYKTNYKGWGKICISRRAKENR